MTMTNTTTPCASGETQDRYVPTDDQSIAIYGIIQRQVARLATQMHLSIDDRLDIAQDCWVELLESLPKFDPQRAPVEGFAHQVVTRRINTVLRRLLRSRRQMISLDLFWEDNDEPYASPLTDRRAEHEDAVAAMAMDLPEILAELSPRDREICDLLQSHTQSEVAQMIGVHRSIVCRCVRRIRAVFESFGYGDADGSASVDSRSAVAVA